MNVPARVVALVPLRGGSKSIPGKNIRPIAGKPLCAWTLEAACGASCIQEVWVSTDSEEIARTVRALGLPVQVLMRPAELATDTASTESVMLHFVEQVPCDVLVTLQATSALTRPEDLEAAFRLFTEGGHDSLLTGVLTKRFFWTPDGRPLNYIPRSRPRRQDFQGSVMENGAFYITRRETLLAERCRLGGRIAVHVLPEESAVEIDEPADWTVVERLLSSRRPPARGPAIRVLFCDVDGTLTDGGMYYAREGESLKRFSTRDAKGLELLRQAGIEVAIVTSEDSDIVRARCRKLGIQECHCGVSDKRSFVEQYCAKRSIPQEAAAFVGDDLNDLEALRWVGLSACPADAVPQVRLACSRVLEARGGHGAVRELCDHLLALR